MEAIDNKKTERNSMANSVNMPGRGNVVPMHSFADTPKMLQSFPRKGERQFMSGDVDCLTQTREIDM